MMSTRAEQMLAESMHRLTGGRYRAHLQQSRGLGDTIHKFTTATGIARVVKRITRGRCGCNRRRDKLNKLIPYGAKP